MVVVGVPVTMASAPEQQKVTALIKEAISVLCKNSLSYTTTFTVEGVLTVTKDCAQRFQIVIDETIGDPSLCQPVKYEETEGTWSDGLTGVCNY